jgi:hypothetical protein
MRVHFWVGYALVPICLAHGWPAMSHRWARRLDRTGLYLATLALCFAIAQVVLGLAVRGAAGRQRRALRRTHLVLMVAIAVLAIGHIAVNSAVVQWLRA